MHFRAYFDFVKSREDITSSLVKSKLNYIEPLVIYISNYYSIKILCLTELLFIAKYKFSAIQASVDEHVSSGKITVTVERSGITNIQSTVRKY